MRSLFRPSKIVGLDIGNSEVKAVAVASGRKKPEIAGVARVSVNFKGASVDYSILESSLRDLKAFDLFPSEWIVSGLNGNNVAVRTITIPQFKRQDGEALVKYEMESLLPYQAEDMVVDYFSRNLPDGKKCRILAMAAQKEDVSNHLDLLGGVKMGPKSLGWNALGAYWALVASSIVPGEGISCLLDMGARSTALVIFDNEGPLLARSLDIGGRDFTESLSAELDVPHEKAEEIKCARGLGSEAGEEIIRGLTPVLERLVQEIEISSLSLQTSLNRIYLTGGASKLPGIDTFFKERLGYESILYNGFDHASHRLSESETVYGPEYTAAFGLAISAFANGSASLDFLREEFAPKKPLRLIRGKLISAGILTAALLGASAAGFFLDLRYKETRYENFKREIRNVYTATFPGVKNIVNEEHQMTNAIEEAKLGLASLAVGGQGETILDIINTISLQIPPESRIKVTELSVGEREILITGEAQSFESVNQLRDRLNAEKSLASVTVEGANANQFNKKIEFRIRMEFEQ